VFHTRHGRVVPLARPEVQEGEFEIRKRELLQLMTHIEGLDDACRDCV